MSSEVVVSVIFRLLNFGVACGAGFYVFKKMLLPDIKEKIAAQHAALQNMTKHNQELLDQKNTVEREISEQEVLGKKLYDQIKLWSFSFEKELAVRRQRREVLDREMERRAREQAENKLRNRVQIEILTSALSGAREELCTRFAPEREGKKFIASLVERMREDMR